MAAMHWDSRSSHDGCISNLQTKHSRRLLSLVVSMMLPSLPEDLVSEICSHCSQGTLTKCARVNSTFLESSRTHLYTFLQLFSDFNGYQFALSALPLLARTRHLRVGSLYVDEHLIRIFRRVIALQHLVSLDLHVFVTSQSPKDASSCIVELSRIHSLQRIRTAHPDLLHGGKKLVPLLLSSALRDLFVQVGLYNGRETQMYRDAALPPLDTLRVAITFTSSSPSLTWTRPPAVTLAHLKRLEIRHNLSFITTSPILSPELFKRFVADIPAHIQSLSLGWNLFMDPPVDIFAAISREHHSLRRFVSLKTLFFNFTGCDRQSGFALDLGVLSGTIQQLYPHAPIQSIQIMLAYTADAVRHEDFVSHSCWMDIRRQYPSAWVTLHLISSDEGTPDLVISGVDEVLWLPSEHQNFTSFEWPFSGLAKIID